MVGETSHGRKDNYQNVNALCLPSDPQQTSQLRLAIHSPCNSVSDIDINNCNRLFWIRNNSLEALRLWNIGKDLGFTYTGEDANIIKRITEMEERDISNRQKCEEGDKDKNK